MQRPIWGEEKPTSPRRGRWSAEEIARLKALYGLKDEAAVSRELQRSVSSVRKMAQSVFKREPRSGPWSAEEILNLRQYLGAADLQTLALILARGEEEIQAQIAELARVKKEEPWSQEDTADFKRLYGTRTDEDLSIILGRRLDEVVAQANLLCIAKDKAFLRHQSRGDRVTKMPRWEAKELEILREMYAAQSNLEIAQALDRSVKSVVSKAHNMGLRKDSERLKEMGRQNVSLRYRNRDS